MKNIVIVTFFNCNYETPKKECKHCIIDWARKEVKKDEDSNKI